MKETERIKRINDAINKHYKSNFAGLSLNGKRA